MRAQSGHDTHTARSSVAVTIRCLECGRPVHPVIGGAWCAEHRPVDLTGGLAPWEVIVRRPSSRGFAPTVRAVHGQVPAMLVAAGWERVMRGAKAYWRSPVTGLVHTQETARRKAFCAKAPTIRGRAQLSPENPTTLHWMALLDGGVSGRAIARETGIAESTIYERVRLARARAAAAAIAARGAA